MTKFCFNCGHKLEYKFSPPNFCPNCGQSINNESNKTQPKQDVLKASENTSTISEDSEGYTNANYVPKISKLQYELDDFGASVQHTIGSLGGKSAPKTYKANIKNINDL